MMRRRVDLIHSFLPLVSIATFWCVVNAQSDIEGSCNPKCVGRQCTRYWWTSMWGFIVTLVALTMDDWGVQKAMDEKTVGTIFETFFYSAINPLLLLWGMLWNIMHCPAMLANLREALGDDVVAPLYPWSKSHIKIISGCHVIVNLSPNVHREIHNLNVFEDKVHVVNLSEALVIGTKVADRTEVSVQLTRIGQLALLRSNVLPPYDELKFLRGNSSLAMAIASVQAIGYIYGIAVRCVQGLRVSPIEAIACILNIVILMKGIFHNFISYGHRPLLLYLLSEEERRFKEECEFLKDFYYKHVRRRMYLATSIACGILLGVGAYFIVNFQNSLNRTCVVPIIFFEVGLIVGGLQLFAIGGRYSGGVVLYSLVLFNLLGYVWALVVTFKYWKRKEFDVRSSNYLSEVLPYIG